MKLWFGKLKKSRKRRITIIRLIVFPSYTMRPTKCVIITSKEISFITTAFGKKLYFLSVENELSCFF